MNFLPVQVQPPLVIAHPQFRMTLPESWELLLRPYAGRSLVLGIRPEHLNLSLPAPKNLPGRVRRIEALGADTFLSVSIHEPGSEEPWLQVRIEPDRAVSPGDEVWLSMMPDKLHLFDPDTGEALRPG
jgi:multiple sugar transport system ATP-binding protein